MTKTLFLHREGIVSIAQMPHEDGGFTHILASPTPRGLLYYVAHRPNRRTKIMKVISGGYRKIERAFEGLYKALKNIKWTGHHPWDPMCPRVQKWEKSYVDAYFDHERLTKSQMTALIYRVCGDRKVTPPQIVFVKKAQFSYFKRCENSTPWIVMSEDCYNTAFVLHEMSHFLADLISPNIDNHGPLFMREYLGLLRDYTTLDIEILREGCRKHRVKYWIPA